MSYNPRFMVEQSVSFVYLGTVEHMTLILLNELLQLSGSYQTTQSCLQNFLV